MILKFYLNICKPFILSEHQLNAVAFTAQLTEDKTLSAGDIIVFDKVLMNYGDGYDQTTGKFRCPVNGIYLVTGAALIADGRKAVSQIQVENSEGSKMNITSNFKHEESWQTAATSAVVECEMNGFIYTVNAWGGDMVIKAVYDAAHQQTVLQSSFTGSLIAML